MKLLKEYIKLIVEELINEDINIERLSPSMLGVYSFAQAINKLQSEGNALPGAIPIDIIDAGENIKSAPLTTGTEREHGTSFQFTGSSFKLYLDPAAKGRMNSADETHDLIHAFTGHLAKAFGRRRQSIENSGQYSISPSKFNKIILDKNQIKRFNEGFEKEFGFSLPPEVFTKPFKMQKEEVDEEDYLEWFQTEFATAENYKKYKTHKETTAESLSLKDFKLTMKLVASRTWNALLGDEFRPGILGQRYYAKYKKKEHKYDFTNFIQQSQAFRINPGEVEYKQSAEDEEEIGNKMNDLIGAYISKSDPIPSAESAAKAIIQNYKLSSGLTGLYASDFKHRFDTPEVKSAMIRLFQLYNEFLKRYKSAKELSNRKNLPKNSNNENIR